MQCRQHSPQACGPSESPLTAGLRLPELQALGGEVRRERKACKEKKEKRVSEREGNRWERDEGGEEGDE